MSRRKVAIVASTNQGRSAGAQELCRKEGGYRSLYQPRVRARCAGIELQEDRLPKRIRIDPYGFGECDHLGLLIILGNPS